MATIRGTGSPAIPFESLLEMAIAEEVDRIIEGEIEIAKQKVTNAIRHSVDKIALQIASSYSVERMGTDIVIRVKKEV